MRIFKIKSFARFCRRERILDLQLREAVNQMIEGQSAASLGGEVFKLRVARQGGGKSGGYRTVVAIRLGHRALFLYGFAKSDRDNLDVSEIETAKLLAREGLSASDPAIEQSLAEGRWTEVTDDEANL